jgi:hypothetical protein
VADAHDAHGDSTQARQGGRPRRSRAASSKTAKTGKSLVDTPAAGTSKAGPALGGRYGKTVKKSVTLRETVVAEIEARTGARGFSEFLDAAAERHLALLKAQEIIADHVARTGEFTNDELAEAKAAWRGE